MFSKACEIGIRAVLLIGAKSLENERVRLKKIVEEIEAPEAFTAKILQKLAKNDIVHSSKGPNGGFFMERAEIDDIKLIQIVKVIDGNKLFNGCVMGLSECNERHPCPIHNEFVKIRNDLNDMLENTSVYELVTGLDKGLSFLKR